jgi:tetratricopeptide (TPR) repeat protein
MAKKIKQKKELSAEEKEAEKTKEAEEAARAAAGIQDEFQARGFELVEWIQEKQAWVLGFIAVVVLGGLAYGVYTVVSASRNSSASAELSKALESYDASVGNEPASKDSDEPHYKDATERAKASRELFLKAADGHRGTGAGAVAHLYAGHASLKLADYDGAIAQYQAFLDGVSKDDPLRFAGLSGLATALEAKNDRKGAIAKLEELTGLPDKIDQDAALLELGRLYQEEGNAQAARAALERLTKDFPESSLKSKADDLLGTLGGAPAEKPAEKPASPPAQSGSTK